jgi:outer membrane protein OmpA-like peptidoglycan-associated protein
MNLFGYATLAAAATVLVSCASPQGTTDALSGDMAAMRAATPLFDAPTIVSDFDTMRTALPTFDLQRGDVNLASYAEISVIRDLSFSAGSDILSQRDVSRLEPLRAYLRTNPSIDVRIEGYGDGVNSAERDAALSLGRAQAVTRALMTDIMVANTIVGLGAMTPQPTARNGSAEVMIIRAVKNHAD